MKKCFLAVFVIAMAAVVSGHADESKSGPCAPDIQKFCPDIKPGGGRIIACLKAHESELSPACKEKRAEVKEQAKEVSAACREDVKKLCADVKPGEGRIRDCLKAHQDQVSEGCKQEIQKVRASHHAAQK